MSAALSPVTLEVVRNGLYAIAEEMSVIVMRSARSPLLKEAGDLSSALTDAQGRLIAQGRDIPIHMGVMGFTVKEFLKRVPAETLRDGDVWFLNLPEVGGNHLPDVKAVRPVFFEGRLVAFAINLVLCVILIPRIGIEGAAVATSTALVSESIMLYRVAKRRLGFHVFILGNQGG